MTASAEATSIGCVHVPVGLTRRLLPPLGTEPLPPYLAWAKRDDTTDIAEQVFEDLRRAPHVYLLPEYGDAGTGGSGRLLARPVRGDVELLADR